MATTEIEKLERRYAENPQGLTFAPLAEVHRKNGETARALELLRAGLELHPNYIPASIVLGRCHWDLGDLPAAEAAFSHVLRLDDENVIALKSLADINERLERFSDAQRWLNRLISVDRSNEEARQQLARLEAAKQQPPSPAAPPAAQVAAEERPAPEAKSVAEAKPAEEVRAVVQAEPAAEAKPIPESEAPVQPKPEPVAAADSPNLDLTVAIAESAGPAAESKGPVLEFLDISEPAGSTVSEEPVPPETPSAPADEPAPLAGLISQEFVPPKDTTFRLHPELTHDYGGSAPAIPDELEVETMEEVELQSSGASEFRVPNAAEDFMEPPPEPRAAQPIPPEAPTRREYSARETRGQSVASFFRALLSARPPGSATLPGAPAPNSDQDAVTRKAASAQEASSGSPAASASNPQHDAVSFDDFFGFPDGGSSSPPKGNADSKDDLDQFQSWLQNLKR